ncbi:putative GTPase activating protein for Arf-domain-containing protein [Cantharellus anzutake]|uniref:putative GTPase activating protein for Arf-domain-containing protein n=1 Tax=Cantharellus anzutake TaxID=1750568 RepID=UPI001904A4B8|nr:putative GTPase activating protein for Arf-domain-containing protein [Cantharellus anzutake]KAF8333152.1 putative GTPase activating protein for Arf-domain-containing protein [Cantharellus anzutake]
MSTRPDKNQRTLAELLTRPGNDICADCRGRAPRWAVWNIGVFVCVSCASIHRKLGTHISKVKSVTLDTWTKDQVESMKNMGNSKANSTYNPDERKNPPPTNADESDRGSEMEKFIRDKYQYKKFMAPVKSSPSPSPLAPLPKDPVPGRTGGVSLGSHSDLEDVIQVIRAPSRAKSTPIVSSTSLSGRGANVLSPPSPALPLRGSSGAQRERVFGSGTLPFRPSTASALEPPAPSSRYTQPSPRPTSSNGPLAPNSQPPLQYLSPFTSTVPSSALPSSSPLWHDMMSLSLQETVPSTTNAQLPFATSGSTSGTFGSPFGGTTSPTSTSLATLRPSGDILGIGTQRSFSMPFTLSPSTAGASAFGGGVSSASGSSLNPFSSVSAHSSGSSFGSGSHLQPQHTSMSLGSTAFLGARASGLGASAWGAGAPPSTPPFGQNGLASIGVPNSIMPPSSLGQPGFGIGANNAFGTIGGASSSPAFQQSYQSSTLGSPFSSSLSPTSSFQGHLEQLHPQHPRLHLVAWMPRRHSHRVCCLHT